MRRGRHVAWSDAQDGPADQAREQRSGEDADLHLGLQYAVAWLSVRSPRFSGMVKSEPSLLLHRDRFLNGAMRRRRVTHDEVVSALRSSGLARPEDAAAVVLETDGSLSVVKATDGAQETEVLRGLSRIDAS